MVTPCPLCHLNLDGYQPKARRKFPLVEPVPMKSGGDGAGEGANRNAPTSLKGDTLPILHLPQLIGLAMGFTPKELGLQRHMVNTEGLAKKIVARAAAAAR
jgi:succinate dehydrogenase / fumarate reductase cytochrome b subunit